MEPIIINHFSRRKEFIQMLAERGAKFGIEIGTDHGQYAQQLYEGIPDLRLFCIDPWVAYTEGEEVKNQEQVEQIYIEASKRLQPYKKVFLMRTTSMEAVRKFDDNSLDFVFIDGDHRFPYVYQDIREWTMKVKPGGIVAGHDYAEDPVRKYGVIRAVQKYTEDNHIYPWFVLHAGGRLADCWMFIRQ